MPRGISAALLVLAAAVATACEPGPPPPEPVAKAYAEAWSTGQYQAMWDLLTAGAQERVGTTGFVDRLPRIAEEMTLRSLDVVVGASSRPRQPSGSPDPARATVPLEVTFHTARVGDVRRATTLSLVLVGAKEQAGGGSSGRARRSCPASPRAGSSA